MHCNYFKYWHFAINSKSDFSSLQFYKLSLKTFYILDEDVKSFTNSEFRLILLTSKTWICKNFLDCKTFLKFWAFFSFSLSSSRSLRVPKPIRKSDNFISKVAFDFESSFLSSYKELELSYWEICYEIRALIFKLRSSKVCLLQTHEIC